MTRGLHLTSNYPDLVKCSPLMLGQGLFLIETSRKQPNCPTVKNRLLMTQPLREGSVAAGHAFTLTRTEPLHVCAHQRAQGNMDRPPLGEGL